MSVRSPVAVIAACIALAVSAPAAAQQTDPLWLRGLEELMTIEVSSVSRKEQRLADTSAAVFVLTRDEIRRSGMRTVADVLRLVPGLHVAQIDGNKWAISARGINGRFANKLLVMIDGRSIYTPYFAGVYWDAVDVPVHVIERIEVIRGPGASIWGANAVNGVINIITTGAAIRRETVVSAGGGSVNYGTVLHQGRLGDRVGYRVFADIADFSEFALSSARGADDDWRQQRAGASFDATLNSRDRVEGSFRGTDGQASSVRAAVRQLVPFELGNEQFGVDTDILTASARWTRQLRGQGHFQVEGFLDQWWRVDDFNHRRHTYDLGVQHRIGVRGRHDLIWGAGYRQTDETTIGSLTIGLTPEDYTHKLANAFVQDEIAIAGGRGSVVLGTKVEHRDVFGWNTQPTARLHWRFTPTQSVWGAVSRAMRAPDRVERGVRFPLAGYQLSDGLAVVTAIQGDPETSPEWLTAYEFGYRTALGQATTLDLATYYNRYTDLRGTMPGLPSIELDAVGNAYLYQPILLRNAAEATTAGGELLLTYAPQTFWKVVGGYTLFSIDSDVVDPAASDFETGGAPRHQGQLRASASLPGAIELDGTLLAVGAVRDLGVASWTRLDGRIAWRPQAPLELSLVVQNVLKRRHTEYGGKTSAVAQFSEIPRTAYGAVTWRF